VCPTGWKNPPSRKKVNNKPKKWRNKPPPPNSPEDGNLCGTVFVNPSIGEKTGKTKVKNVFVNRKYAVNKSVSIKKGLKRMVLKRKPLN